jgi:hypothetical protein
MVGWLGLVALAFPLPFGLSEGVALWIWQILIVGSGIPIAAAPLFSAALAGQQNGPSFGIRVRAL